MQHLQEYLHKLYRYAVLSVTAKSTYYIIIIIISIIIRVDGILQKVLNDHVAVSISNVTE